jgi:hypothetical protein
MTKMYTNQIVNFKTILKTIVSSVKKETREITLEKPLTKAFLMNPETRVSPATLGEM